MVELRWREPLRVGDPLPEDLVAGDHVILLIPKDTFSPRVRFEHDYIAKGIDFDPESRKLLRQVGFPRSVINCAAWIPARELMETLPAELLSKKGIAPDG